MNTDAFIRCIDNINEKTKTGVGLVDSQLLDDFDSKCRILGESIQGIQTEGRNLRIGVVGAVKAGKSTFLNALLFNGETILPKAPTPMTAALTKVKYAEEPSAKIFFYSRQEWNKIEKKAEEYRSNIEDRLKRAMEQYERQQAAQAASASMGGMTYILPAPTYESVEACCRDEISIELSSCNELVRMLDKSIPVTEYLEKGEITISNKSNYDDELSEYVGANGKFTPIVKYIELEISNELLKDLEIVDTPGLNDPILSRSKKTQDFLLQCDVIFVLSYAGQFLTSEDMVLIKKVLPQEGIKHAVIIASKFDSGLLDYNKRDAKFIEALRHTCNTLKKAADSSFVSYGRNLSSMTNMDALKKSKVMFTSGLIFGIAKKLEAHERLDEEETHLLNQLKKRFPDFDSSIKNLYELSGMEMIRKEVLEKIRVHKDEIVKMRIEEFEKIQQGRLLALLEEINLDLKRNLNDINQYEYGTLQEKAKKLSRNLDSVRKAINAKFSDAAINAQKHIQTIISEINIEMENHRNIMIGREEKTDKEVIKSGLFGVMRQEVIRTYKTNTAEMNEVIENTKQYCSGIHQIIISRFDKLINIDGLKQEVKDKIQSAFDTADKDFDPDEIAITLNKMIGTLIIPKISLNAESYRDKLLSRFPETGTVRGDEIAELKTQQSIVLQEIFADAKKELEEKATILENDLNKCAGDFIDNIERKMLQQIKIVQDLLIDKQRSIGKLEKYAEMITECKQLIREI